MSTIGIVILTYHRHKPIDLKLNVLLATFAKGLTIMLTVKMGKSLVNMGARKD
jgi:hypothetical protein